MTVIPEEWRKVSGYEGKYEVMTPSEAVSATVNSMRGRPRKDKSKTA